MKRDESKFQGVPEELLAQAERIGGESAVIRQLLEHYTPRQELERKQRWFLALLAGLLIAGLFVLAYVIQGRSFAAEIEKERVASATDNCERLNDYGAITASVLVDARNRQPIPDPNDPEAVARYKAGQDFYDFNIRKFAPRDCTQVVGRATTSDPHSLKETS